MRMTGVLPTDARAKDLASKMTVEQIAGLICTSAHQAIPANPKGLARALAMVKPIDSERSAGVRYKRPAKEILKMITCVMCS